MILKRVLLVIMIKIFKDVDNTIRYFKFLTVKMPVVILKVGSEELMQTIFIKRPAQIFEYPGIAQRNRTQYPVTAPNTSMSAKHSHSMFILSRGDMVKHEVGVCVYTCVRCACAVNL